MTDTHSQPGSPPPEPPVSPAAGEPDPTLVHVVYGLYALGFVNGLTAIIGAIIAHLRRQDVAGTYLESHFTWQIRTFWISLLAALAGFVLMVIGIGFLILIAVAIWLIYRIVKGWLRLADKKPVEDPQAWF